MKEFSSLLEDLGSQREFNGTVLIAQDGQILFEKSIGFADVNSQRKLSDSSAFRLASVSKQFTAMCIMMLKEDGKLDFDDSITKHLRELPYKKITIRHLLNHTSGLPDYMGMFSQHWDQDVPDAKKKLVFNKDVLAMFAKHKPKPSFASGDRFEYSNTGYALLANIVESTSGMPIGKFMSQRIFKPLEMKNSKAFEGNDTKDSKDSNRVFGFEFMRKGKFGDNDHHFLNGIVGDGGVYASARDLIKWDEAWRTEKLVSKKSIDEAFKPGQLNDGSNTDYGFGWVIGKNNKGHLRVIHNGAWVGFQTYIQRETEEKKLLVILTNCSGYDEAAISKGLKQLGQTAK